MNPSPGRQALGWQALGWLLHPVSLTALVVLLLNDHVLKVAWPGVVTGKLSDLAGLALAPAAGTALVALVAPRLPVRAVAAVATMGTGTAFALVKATATGAAAATAAWSWASGPSVVLRDPTDLVALPALAVGWWAFTHAARHPLPRRTAELVVGAVVLPTAGLAILATTPGDYPEALDVNVRDGSAVVLLDNQYQPPGGIETGDGRTWRDLRDGVRKDGETGQLPEPVTRACVPADPRHCFRTVPGRLAVQESRDAGVTWADAWTISRGRQRFLSRAYPEARTDGADVRARSLGILPLDPVTDGATARFVVVVAAVRDGILVRHEDGRWERIGFPTAASHDAGLGTEGAPGRPPGLTAAGRRIAMEYAYAALAVTLGLLAGGLAAAGDRGRAWAVVPAASAAFFMGVAMVSTIGAVLGVSSVPGVIVVVTLGLAGWVLFVRSSHTLALGPAVTLAALALAVVVLGATPFIGWSAGRVDDYGAAARSAAWLVGGGLVLMTGTGVALLVRRRRKDERRRPITS